MKPLKTIETMRNDINQIENLHWKVKEQLIPIKKISTTHLKNIRNTINLHPGNYSGLESEYWEEKIKYYLDFRRVNNTINSQLKVKTAGISG